MTTRELSASEQEWLEVRRYLNDHRHELGKRAAALYRDAVQVEGTPLLSRPEWLPQTPVPLDSIKLEYAPDAAPVQVPWDRLSLPQRSDSTGFTSYAEAVGELTRPALFENRPTYRLLEADFAAPTPALRFGRGTYFDHVDVGDACAHEFAGLQLGRAGSGFRAAIGDPCDPSRRPTNVAISTLTLRHDRTTDSMSLVLHWRDPKKVGHAGGLYHVVPTGIFQASGLAAWNERNDFSLWRNMVREFAEELAAHSEDHGSEQTPIDYEAWPFFRTLTGASQRYCLGLGVDPLTLATDLLTVVIIDSETYDEAFEASGHNAEGVVLEALPFDQGTVHDLQHNQPMQAAGAALIGLAWKFRHALK